MKNLDYAIATGIIGIISAVVLMGCAIVYPIRLIIDASSDKQRSLCPKCAGLNRRAWYEMFYRPGDHTCSKCGTVTSVAMLKT